MKSSTMEVVESGLGKPCEVLEKRSEGKDPSSQVAREQKRGYWAALLERQRASGLTITAFCRQEHVPMDKFFYWKRRLAHDAPSPPGSSRRRMRSGPGGWRLQDKPGGRRTLHAPSDRRTPPPSRNGAGPMPSRAFLFSELRMGPPSGLRPGGAEIITSGGLVIRADAGVDAAWVARLVRALEGKAERPC